MKVLLAIDEEPCSEEAINEVGARRWEEGTTVRVLHAVGKFVPPAQELWHDAGGSLDEARREIKNRSTELVERTCGWLREQGLGAEAAVRDGEPGPAIVEEAKEWGANLIVVGSRGHTGLRRMLEGSVSRYVVDHAPCPVEVIHCKETGEAEDG
ncbi:MAG TPA: universal stress protein [Gaiellaceae bacterium]|nr:universal stress protein [Gaiellaceae bacterium]